MPESRSGWPNLLMLIQQHQVQVTCRALKATARIMLKLTDDNPAKASLRMDRPAGILEDTGFVQPMLEGDKVKL